ncbi:MAG: RimK family alpha-L-glutamate ligase [Hellea sp.]
MIISRTLNIAILTADPSNYSNQRMMEAGHAAGHDIYPLPTLDQIISVHSEGYIKGLHPMPDAVIPRIGVALSSFGQILITAFENSGIPTTTSSFGLAHSRDKFRAGQYLGNHGIHVPKTLSFASPRNIDVAIRAVGGYPFILKKLQGTQGEAVFLINDVDKAHRKLGKYIRKRKPFLIQQYIKESKGSDLRCFVIGGKVIAAMKRTAANDDFRANIHAGGVGQAVKLSPEEHDMAVKAAKLLKLPIAGVDILQSDNGPLLLEVNSSPGLQGIEKATGKDIAGEIIHYIDHMVNEHG